MCTVSWRRERDGYELFFNRDELNSRAPESPPERCEHGDVAFLAPRDGARGGTWLLANEHGVTVCLLNDYAAAWRPAVSAVAADERLAPAASRGQVVLACAATVNLGAVAATVRAQPLNRVAPFHLLALTVDEEPLRLHWDGDRLLERRGAMVFAPMSSSSFATAEVIAARLARFPQFAEMAEFHRQHDPRAGAHSVLMRRPDASTRSISRVRVDAGHVRLDYEAVAWSEAGATFTPARHELPRRRRG